MKFVSKIGFSLHAVLGWLNQNPALLLLIIFVILQRITLCIWLELLGVVGGSALLWVWYKRHAVKQPTLAWCGVIALCCVLLSQTCFSQTIPQQWFTDTHVLSGVIYHKTAYYCDLKVKTSDQELLFPMPGIRLSGMEMASYLPGDELVVTLSLKQAEIATNPGQFNYHSYLLSNGIGAVSEDIQTIQLIGRHRRLRAAYDLRQTLIHILQKRLPDSVEGLAIAMLMGDKTYLTERHEQTFQAAGVMHILVVSGLHLSMLTSILLLLCVLGLRFSMRMAVCITLVVIWGYIWLIGGGVSVVRAAIMLTMILLARVFYLPSKTITRIASAALIILMVYPQAIYAVGFQLSFGATLGIICLGSRYGKQGAGWIKSAIFTTLAALSLTLPILIYHYHYVSLFSVIANVIILPLGWLTMILGFLVLLPIVGSVLSLPLTGLLFALQGCAQFFSDLPFAQLSMQPWPVWLWLLYYLGIYIIICNPISKKYQAVQFGLILVIVIAVLMNGVGQKDFEVTFLDVGQGDSVYLSWPHGYKLLIDGGLRDAYRDYGKSVVVPFLRWSGVNRLDAILVSHADADHCGGLKTVLEQIDVKTLYLSRASYEAEEAPMQELIALCYKKGVSISILSEKAQWDVMPGSRLEVLSQQPFLMNHQDVNNSSLVVKIMYGSQSFLFTGDIEQGVEYSLSQNLKKQLDCDVLKVPHHGSKSSSTLLFLKKVSPQIAICSVGRNNRFGHPHSSVLKRYSELDIPFYRTDQHGAITVSSDGKNFRINTFMGSNP